MEIRKATEADILVILQLVKKMVDYHYAIDKIYKPYQKYKGLEKYLKGRVQVKNSILLVAEDGDKLIGFLEGGIEKASNEMIVEKIGIIDNIFVEEKHRKEKIGQKLLNFALKYFNLKNIQYIQINTDARNNTGRGFWKKNNFFEYQINMLKKLK